jgi:hypothetical protein
MQSLAEDFLANRIRTASRLPFVLILEVAEVPLVLVRLDYVARVTINADHGIM